MKKFYLKKDFKALLTNKLTDYAILEEKSGLAKNTLFRIQRELEPEPKRKTLDAICQALDVQVARDDEGIYFYEKSEGLEVLKEYLSDDEIEIFELLKKMTPEQRAEYVNIIKGISDLVLERK